MFVIKKKYRNYIENRLIDVKIFNDVSSHDEGDLLMLIYFSDELLNQEAEQIGLRVQLVDKYETLPFEMIGQVYFQRFNAQQKLYLMERILNKAIDIQQLINIGAIKEHFVLHQKARHLILPTWERYGFKLMIGMVTGNFKQNLMPISLI